jgi:hypothetical protein
MGNHYKAIKVNGIKKDEHRHIMEVHLGRRLASNEVVHHKDGNKRNNNLSNLEVMSLSEHSRMHMTGSTLKPETIEKIRVANKLNCKGNPKLTDDQVVKVKILLRNGLACAAIGRLFSIHRTTISNIKRGISYKWV